jgi:hypothetical protein
MSTVLVVLQFFFCCVQHSGTLHSEWLHQARGPAPHGSAQAPYAIGALLICKCTLALALVPRQCLHPLRHIGSLGTEASRIESDDGGEDRTI